MQALLALLGAGLGVAVMLGSVELYGWTHPGEPLPLAGLVAGYIGTAAVGSVIFLLLSGRIIDLLTEAGQSLVQRLDRMSMTQILSGTVGLTGGLMIAALLSQILTFMGQSLFTTVLSVILYLGLGLLGLTIGLRRSDDFGAFVGHLPHKERRRFRAKGGKLKKAAAGVKLLDASALIDGRVLEVWRAGFLEGTLVVPAFVLTELRRVADSTDPQRRARGRRGLEVLEKLQSELNKSFRLDETDYDDADEADVKLLRLARQQGAAIVTGDYSLSKAASAAGVRALNLNALAGALRPAVLPGEEMTVEIVKEGREPGQGVAYMPDGTMIVVENGRRRLGETVTIIVATALQTNAGRMIFAKIKEV